MDEVWANTVRRLEADLSAFRQMKERYASEDDPAAIEEMTKALMSAKIALDRKYSQLIAFAAGLSDDHVDFDADLNVSAIVVSRRGNVSYIFGPESVSSSEPFFSPELKQFIADQISVNGSPAAGAVPGGIQCSRPKIGDGPEAFASAIAASHTTLSQSLIEFNEAEGLADRVEAAYSVEFGAANSDAVSFMSRSLDFAGRLESLRDIRLSDLSDMSPAIPHVDFEYLSW